MSNPRPALRCRKYTIQNYRGRHDGGNSLGEKLEEEKIKSVFTMGGGEAANPEIWNLSMHPYVYGVWNKRTTYLFHIVR